MSLVTIDEVLMKYYRQKEIAKRESTKYKERCDILNRQLTQLKDRLEKNENEIIMLKKLAKENLDDCNVLGNIYDSMNIDIDYFRKNIDELTNEVANNGLIFKGKTRDIWDASEKGSLAALKFYFIENPENINKKNENYYNWTPLHYAAKMGRLVCLSYLFLKGAEIDALSTTHSTPLMEASARGNIHAINFLLDRGANINHQNSDKRTSLHLAYNYDVYKLLIQREADKYIKDIYGRLPLIRNNNQ